MSEPQKDDFLVTYYRYDAANQLVLAKGPDGTVTRYAYDAAGRMVEENRGINPD